MSIIRDQEKLNAAQLETIKLRNEREIKKSQAIHQDLKAEMRKTHAGELVNLQDEHQRDVEVTNQKKEKVMNQIKSHLDRTKEMTDKELDELKKRSNQVRVKDQIDLTNDRNVLADKNELHVMDINERYNDALKRVHEDGKGRIQERTAELREELANQTDLAKSKLQLQSEEATARYRNEGALYEQLKEDQANKFKKDHVATNQKQQYEMAKMTNTHLSHVEMRDQAARKDIKNQDLAFEKKYAEHLKIHQENLNRLNNQNETVVKTMKDGVTEQLMNTVKRSDDPFFRFTKLSPILTQHPDHVEVKVEIPEHSKQDVQLTTNTKEVVINFNRRYDDSHSPAKGIVNKLHKVETYTTRLATDHILDPKSVKATYQNGVMTYIIKHA
jgi:HSP20 family molecular chaperone IbpA